MYRKNPPQKTNNVVRLPFHSVRHISCPEDLESGRRVYAGYATVSEIVDLPTDENVRGYLVEAEGKKRKRPTSVHKAILDTLENYSHNFSVLNSGVVIVARQCEIDEKHKELILRKASIINGSQTQGVVRDFIRKRNGDTQGIHIKFEVIVTDDEELIAEVSIARNFQDDVMTISIAGRRGYLDELEESLQKRRPGSKLKKSETQLSDDYVKTERVLQVIAALIPEEIWPKEREFNKVYTYSQKTKCLRDFEEIYKNAKKNDEPVDKRYVELYGFYLDIVAEADELYEKWKIHQGFKGTGLRCLTRDGKREIKNVPDGIIFPILASLSVFATKKQGRWTIQVPHALSDDELIRVAKTAYMEIARSNYNKMGKTKACYSALYEITSIYKKLTKMALNS